jgi:hypothetical protein
MRRLSLYPIKNYLRFTPGLSLYPAVKIAEMNAAITPNTKIVLTAVCLLYSSHVSVRYHNSIIAYERACLKDKVGQNLTKRSKFSYLLCEKKHVEGHPCIDCINLGH